MNRGTCTRSFGWGEGRPITIILHLYYRSFRLVSSLQQLHVILYQLIKTIFRLSKTVAVMFVLIQYPWWLT